MTKKKQLSEITEFRYNSNCTETVTVKSLRFLRRMMECKEKSFWLGLDAETKKRPIGTGRKKM